MVILLRLAFSLSTIPLRYIQIVACIDSSFLFTVESNGIDVPQFILTVHLLKDIELFPVFGFYK